jgi:hypothetical protein
MMAFYQSLDFMAFMELLLQNHNYYKRCACPKIASKANTPEACLRFLQCLDI